MKVGVQAGVDNFPVTIQDINIAKTIFGKDICLLKKKSVWSKPLAVLSNHVAMPQQMRKLHNKIILFVDAFFVQKIPIFITLSKNIKFQMTVVTNSHKSTSFVEVLERVFAACNKREFSMVEMCGDPEF